MDFLQHFLPGQPVEKNGQTSGGATLLRYTTLGPARITAGFDTEIANGYLEEIQANPETGNPGRRAGTTTTTSGSTWPRPMRRPNCRWMRAGR